MNREQLRHRQALQILLQGRLTRYPVGHKGRELRRELERFARRHRRWLANPEIEGFSFGERRVKGRITAEPALIILVRKKLRDPAAIRHPIPRKIRIPTLGVFRTDVLGVGKFKIHSGTEFPDTVRPLQPGTCIGIAGGESGTLGCFVRKRGTVAPLILSCAHVLTNSYQTAAGPGVDVQQTAANYQDPAGGNYSVALGTEIVPPVFSPSTFPNLVDAGLASVLPGLQPVDPAMRLTGSRPATGGDIVKDAAVVKVGFAGNDTTPSTGRIVFPEVTMSLSYPDPNNQANTLRAGYARVVACSYDAEKGDSGAAVLSADGTQLLGVHMGGWSNYSVFCRFDLIAAKLDVEPY